MPSVLGGLGLGQPAGHLHQAEQCDGGGCATSPHPESAASSALASCKSAVSKPSVNQL